MARLPKRPRQHVLEDESGQFARRVLPSEWITERKEHDYGIDLQVEIVTDESVTGARFSVQLKSTDTIKVRKKAYIAHPCATSALFYYLQLSEPVIYLVYDAKEDQGYWVWIQEFLRGKEVDPNWKDKEEVTVRIPKENIFDGRAVKQIAEKVLDRHDQARWMQAVQTANNPYYNYTFAMAEQEFGIGIYPRYPGAERDSPMKFSGTFKFDQSDEGRAASEALDKAVKTGSFVRIDSRFFEGFDLPAALPDLFAHVDDFHLDAIEMRPVIDERRIPTRILALDSQKTVLGELPYIEFRQVQSGTEEVTFSNEHQGIPIKMRHIINKLSGKMSYSIGTLLRNQNVASIQEFLYMHRALRQATYLRVVGLANQQSLDLDISGENVPEISEHFVNLIDDLVLIQERMNVPFAWSDKMTANEFLLIKHAADVLRTGRYGDQPAYVVTTVNKSTAQKTIAGKDLSKEMPMEIEFDSMEMSILGKSISFGSGRFLFPGVKFKPATRKILRGLDSLPNDLPVKLEFSTTEPSFVEFIEVQP